MKRRWVPLRAKKKRWHAELFVSDMAENHLASFLISSKRYRHQFGKTKGFLEISKIIALIVSLSAFSELLEANEPDTKSFWYNNGSAFCNYLGPKSNPMYQGIKCPNPCDYLSCSYDFTEDCQNKTPYTGCPVDFAPKKVKVSIFKEEFLRSFF